MWELCSLSVPLVMYACFEDMPKNSAHFVNEPAYPQADLVNFQKAGEVSRRNPLSYIKRHPTKSFIPFRNLRYLA